MPEIRDLGVVVDTRPFRERDLIIAILTPGHGVVRGVFRRARGGRAPRAAATQVLSVVRCSAYQGPHAELASFRDVDLVLSSFPLAAQLETSTAAAVVAELLVTFCPPGEPAAKPFRLGRAILEALLGGLHPDGAIAYTQLWTLRLDGVLPPLQRCGQCGGALTTAGIHTTAEGLLCSRCGGEGNRLEERDMTYLAAVLGRPPSELADPPSRTLAAWLDALVRAAAERRLPALDLHRDLARREGG
jgi:DNA repair protein RecO (recombination protein O)